MDNKNLKYVVVALYCCLLGMAIVLGLVMQDAKELRDRVVKLERATVVHVGVETDGLIGCYPIPCVETASVTEVVELLANQAGVVVVPETIPEARRLTLRAEVR